MAAVASQTYLKTRIGIMSHRLLTLAGYERMLAEPLDRLGQQYGVPAVFERGAGEEALHRTVETNLIHTLLDELSILLRPLHGEERELLIHWIRKYELFNLKALIRGKLHGLSYTLIRENLYELPPRISLPHEELLRTENVSELLRQLEKTAYRGIARQARRVYEEKSESFSIDATIDQRYYAGLIKRAGSGRVRDKPALLDLLGTLIDQQNLTWLLRYRFNYHLSPSKTYYLLIPSAGRLLPPDRLKRLVNMTGIEQVIEALPERLRRQLAGDTDLLFVEQIMARETAGQAGSCIRSGHSAIAASLAYLVLREMDLKRIYTIILGRIAGLAGGLIRRAAGLEVVDV